MGRTFTCDDRYRFDTGFIDVFHLRPIKGHEGPGLLRFSQVGFTACRNFYRAGCLTQSLYRALDQAHRGKAEGVRGTREEHPFVGRGFFSRFASEGFLNFGDIPTVAITDGFGSETVGLSEGFNLLRLEVAADQAGDERVFLGDFAIGAGVYAKNQFLDISRRFDPQFLFQQGRLLVVGDRILDRLADLGLIEIGYV